MNEHVVQKAVAIDGVNFGLTYRSLGVGEISYQHLLGSLRRNVGDNLPIQCRSTIHPELHTRKSHLYWDMRRAGVEMFPSLSCTSEDDGLVRQWIHYFGNKINVHELVVITCDHDIIEEALSFLDFARKRGKTFHVYIVGTAIHHQHENCRISNQTLSAIRECTCAHFIELRELVRTFACAGKFN